MGEQRGSLSPIALDPAAALPGAAGRKSGERYEDYFVCSEWQERLCRRRSGKAAAVGLARRSRSDRNEVRLWHGALRMLHGASEWRCGSFLRDSGGPRGGTKSYDDRRTLVRPEPSGSTGVARGASSTMRLLPAGSDDVRGMPAG